jgi:diguanylate cyclase (GGDEF)-like protein
MAYGLQVINILVNEHLSREHLTSVQGTVEGLAGIAVAFYDAGGKQLLAPMNQDPLVSLLSGTVPGKEDHQNFISGTVRTAAYRKDATLTRSPFEQYYIFIPHNLGDKSLVLVAGAFYLSEDEFRNFISRRGLRYHLSYQQIEKISKQIRILNYEAIKKLTENISRLFHLAMRYGFENRQLRKECNRTKAIIRLISNLEEQSTERQLHEFFSEMLIFLFNVETLSIVAEKGEYFESIFSAGRLRERIASVSFLRNTMIIEEVLKKKQPRYCNDPVDLRGIGLGEEIESLWLFPYFAKNKACQLFCLYNTELSNEEEEEITEALQLIATMAATISARDSYTTRMQGMTMLNLATSGLSLAVKQPEVLYASIVDTAVKISKAERGSLMLDEDGSGELSIKAVHGINKWLLKDLKIRAGEGIAGRVFQESLPVLSENIEKQFSVQNRPIYKTSSFMSIPLKVGDETIGVLNISDKLSGEVFLQEDLALLHSFANYASIALKGSSYCSIAENMKELSITDPLTNLYNRRYFEERLAEEIDRSERHSLNLSLCIIDIDDFKLFNDTEGHPAGDEILIRFSRLLHESLRAIDVLARIGGEEFAIIMPQTDKDEAYFVAERTRNTVKQKMDRTWKQCPKEHMTVSIGISTFPVDGTEVKRLISNADKALYRAKMHGKDKTCAWKEHTSF